MKTKSSKTGLQLAESMEERVRVALSEYVDERVRELVCARRGHSPRPTMNLFEIHGLVQEILSDVIGRNGLLAHTHIHGAASWFLSSWMDSCEHSEANWSSYPECPNDWEDYAAQYGFVDCPEWPLANLWERPVEYATELLDAYTGEESWAAVMFRTFLFNFDSDLDKLFKLVTLCASPLEMAVAIGFLSLAETDVGVHLRAWDDVHVTIDESHSIYPQRQVGKYRVDFAIESNEFHKSTPVKIAVELDGHEFHERTVDQAVHDRQRDRFLVSEGWKVVRYHRKEIADDLMKVVKEIVGMAQKLT